MEYEKKISNSFLSRYKVLKDLLNRTRKKDNKKYTDEYIADCVGVFDYDEFKKYINGEKEPSKDIKERFVNAFGVNYDWFVYGRNNRPFQLNEKITNGSAMDILIYQELNLDKQLILVIGNIDGRRELCVVIKRTEDLYELYPQQFVFNSIVGAWGSAQLINVYRFIREARKRRLLFNTAFIAEDGQFANLIAGKECPQIVNTLDDDCNFIDDFLDLNTDAPKFKGRIWDEDLVKVKQIIASRLKEYDDINQEDDVKRIEKNLLNDRLIKNSKDENSELKELRHSNLRKKIFISHSSKDSEYVKEFVYLLKFLGFTRNNLICTSFPSYGIPNGEKIYDWIINEFYESKLHIIYMFSDNYYKSPACLNEMGAVWAFKNKWDAILLPGFGFEKINGCVDKDRIVLKLDDSEIRFRLNELMEDLVEEFGLKKPDTNEWEVYRDKFLDTVKKIDEANNSF